LRRPVITAVAAVGAVAVITVLAAVLRSGPSEVSEPVRDVWTADSVPVTTEATVDMILRDPRAYGGVDLVVGDGTVVPLDVEGGFLLKGTTGAILVYAPGGVPRLEGLS
jgi:hypothetical protein